ncbi:MAG: hypothetical protein AB7V00_06095 [Bacilli bacterium]
MTKCKICGNIIYPKQKFCGNCGQALLASDFASNQSTNKDKGYNSPENRAITILLLVLSFPIGLIYMWTTQTFSKTTRVLISTILMGMALLGLLIIIIWTSLPGYNGFIRSLLR